ncbi:MAG TPA: MlaD family protein [Verrucomicrobiae bacterium]|nr:MlaD family protein [Verrucomicrobiae bacterium]
MNRKKLEWKVGVFVFVCLVLLGALMVSFSKGLTFFKPTYTVRLKAKSVGGIKEQAAVLMAGVPVGSVTGAELSPDGRSVTVFLRILSRYQIHGDAMFTIDSMGFLGDQYVMIIPTKNEAPVLQDGDEVTSREPFNLQEVARSATGVIQRIDEAAQKLNEVLIRVDRQVFNEETLTNLSATITNFRQVSERALVAADNIDRLVKSNSQPVSISVSNLAMFSRQLNELGDGFQQLLSTNRTQVTAAVKSIESAGELMKGLLVDLQAGEGLAGSLLKDEHLEAGFSQLVSNLTVLSSNLNRHGLLWKPRKTEVKPPSKLYPGRDPRR